MKQKIIEILGHHLEPELAELKSEEILHLFDNAFIIADGKQNIEGIVFDEEEAKQYCLDMNENEEDRKDHIGYKKVDLIINQ